MFKIANVWEESVDFIFEQNLNFDKHIPSLKWLAGKRDYLGKKEKDCSLLFAIKIPLFLGCCWWLYSDEQFLLVFS